MTPDLNCRENCQRIVANSLATMEDARLLELYGNALLKDLPMDSSDRLKCLGEIRKRGLKPENMLVIGEHTKWEIEAALNSKR